ncbi:MAG TPA: twin-arginine translocase TatA/TatE family subunit [Pirellulales bacterium]|nr:twin-arginine translocase TatA/TatE family subunit [Pirellulales bacterium]
MFEGFLAPSHVLIIAIAALFLFGDRLPEVMRSVGKGILEFKKGMRGIESAIEAAATASPATTNQMKPASSETTARPDEIAAPRFDPPTGEPRAESSATLSASQAPPAPHVVAEDPRHEAEVHQS